MDPSFLRESQARTLRSGRFKLVLMAVGLVVLVLCMAQLARRAAAPRAGDGDEPRPVGKQLSTDVPPVDMGGEGKEPGVLAVPPDQLGERFEFMRTDDVYKRISDQDTTLEPGPFFRLLYVVSQDEPEALKAAASAVEWKTLWERPAEARARPLTLRGTVVRLWRQPLGENPMGLEEVWAYRVRAEGAPQESQGHLYDVYAVEKLRGALRHDKVAACGRFLKPQIIEPDSERFLQDPDLHVAVCVVRRFEPLTYLDEPDVPQPVRDGTRPEARAFYYLLKRAREAPFDQLEARARSGLTYLDFANNPDRHRGKPVVVQGELRRCVRMALPENVLGVPDVYYGQLVDADRKMNTFYVVHVPEGVHLKDPVQCYGYFLKNWTYVSQGSQVLSCPVFVGQRLVVVEYEPSYTLEVVLGAIVVATVVVLFVAYLRDRQRQAALAEARRQRQLARIPDHLDDVGRRVSAAARGDEPPEPGEPPPPDA